MTSAAALPDSTILSIEDYWTNDSIGTNPPWRDPYLRWAALTNFRSLQRNDGEFPAKLSFIVERSTTSSDWQELNRLDGVKVEAAYSEPLSDDRVARFATLRVTTEDLSTPEVALRVMALLRHPHVERLQLGYPRGRNRGFDHEPPCSQAPAPCARPVAERADVVIGVIDEGCPFAHRDLRDALGGTRVAALWQQSTFDKPVLPWSTNGSLGYGRVLDRAAMNDFIEGAEVAGSLDELLCYQAAFAQDDEGPGRKWIKPNRALLKRTSHGSGVMSAAAGQMPALHGARPTCENGGDLHGARGDAASACPIVFVEMPREQIEISSGRWLPVNGLDGLRFILQEARGRYVRPNGLPVPVVANLSAGSTAGAHRGEAMLERAMDELLDADDELAITLAAGNSRNAESHARLDVPRQGSASIGVFVPPAQPFDTFVEFWMPQGVDLTKLTIIVTSPDGLVLAVDAANREAEFVDDPVPGETPEEHATRVGAALLFYPRVAQATHCTMALLAICGTLYSGRRLAVATAGPWRVTVVQQGATPLQVQAWIERDEIGYGNRRDQAARFFAVDNGLRAKDSPVREANTLSNIATGAHVFTVGGYRGPKASGPVADYSGEPSEDWTGQRPRRYLPFAAKADAGKSHPGVRVPGNRGNVVWRMNGTSVSAPQAARYVANEMAKGLTRQQVEAALPRRPAPLPRPGKPTKYKVDRADGRKRL